MDIIDLIERVKRFGLENVFRRYYSVYTAQVIDNEDEKNRGRVKVVVPDILDDKELKNWAEPMLPTAGYDEKFKDTKTKGRFGVFFPPKVGDYLWVKFRMGDIRKPVYCHGGWWAKDEKPEALDTDRKNAIFISRFGHTIIMDETEDAAKFTVEMESGSKIEIDDTKDKNNILITTDKGTLVRLDDTKDAENVTITDANGDLWKWDIKNKLWTVLFKGDKEETIEGFLKQEVQKAVEQTFKDKWDVNVTSNGTIKIGGKAIINAASNASFWGEALTHLGAETGAYKVPLGELLLTAVNLNVSLFGAHQHPTAVPLTGTPTTKEQNIKTSVLSQKVKLV